MRTPAAMIVGLVLAPCGLVFALTCTFAPDWRELSSIPGASPDSVEHQGIWDICSEVQATHQRTCGVQHSDYFSRPEVQGARGLMISSMVVTLLGVALTSLGVRCWRDEEPSYTLAGCGGLVVFASGVLSLVAVSWYNFQLYVLPGFTQGSTLTVGYALVLGYIGSCFEIIGGFSLMLSFVHSCKEALRARGKASPAAKYYSNKAPGVGAGAPYSREPARGSDYPDYSVRSAEHQRGGYSSDPYRGDYNSDPRRDYSSNDPRRDYSSNDPRRDYSSNDPRRDYTSDYGSDPRLRDSVSTVPRSYTNPLDVTAGEQPYRVPSKPRSHLSSLPCDSDLL